MVTLDALYPLFNIDADSISYYARSCGFEVFVLWTWHYNNITNQPQIAVDEQIRLLKSEGLSFGNECRAKHLLNNISMFRLKSYLKPLRQQNTRRFKPGAKFEQAYTLYKFDSLMKYHSNKSSIVRLAWAMDE